MVIAIKPGFVDEGDVVGTAAAPAALRASDATNLYLRIRLDGDPAPKQNLKAASWGIELDLDGDPTKYEMLMLVDGIAANNEVELFTNHTMTLANDPTDPADQPAGREATRSRTTRARSRRRCRTPATIPTSIWTSRCRGPTCVAAGMQHGTAVRLWVASSTSPDSLNGDFACNDGADGVVHLDGADSDATTGDPANDPNGGGSGSNTGSGGERLEGGGGCSTTGGGSTSLFAIALVVFAAMTSGRSRRV